MKADSCRIDRSEYTLRTYPFTGGFIHVSGGCCSSAGYSLGAFFGSFLLFVIIVILHIVAMWKIYVKAGVPGWGAVVPIDNVYLQFKIAWKTKMCWIMLACPIIPSFLSGIEGSTSNSESFTIATALLTVAASITAIVISIMNTVKLAQAFGKGVWFAVGLIFLNIVFCCVLAFGDSQYIGNPSNQAQRTEDAIGDC